eukprot:7923287-Pyramimonas_sp.AAC.1
MLDHTLGRQFQFTRGSLQKGEQILLDTPEDRSVEAISMLLDAKFGDVRNQRISVLDSGAPRQEQV